MGYADDIALLVVAKHLEDADVHLGVVISVVKSWLESSGLILVEEKTEAVVIREIMPQML